MGHYSGADGVPARKDDVGNGAFWLLIAAFVVLAVAALLRYLFRS